MSTKQNPNKDSTSPKSNRKSGRGSRQRKGRRSGNNGSGGQKGPDPFVVEAISRAKSRFEQQPPAMGLPAELNPPPQNVKLKWKLKLMMLNNRVVKRRWVSIIS